MELKKKSVEQIKEELLEKLSTTFGCGIEHTRRPTRFVRLLECSMLYFFWLAIRNSEKLRFLSGEKPFSRHQTV